MITYEELHHVGITVTNLEKAKHFYGHILCLQEIQRPNFDFEGAWYGIGQQQLHLLVCPNSQTIRQNKTINSREGHVALRVNDYEETLNWLNQHHVEVLEKPNSVSGFAQIFCTDPDGNIIELHVEQAKKPLKAGE